MRRIFNSFYLASTIVVLVNQSVEANQVSAGGVEGISSTSQTIKLKVGNSGQKIRQVRASKIAQTLPSSDNSEVLLQNLRSQNQSLPAKNEVLLQNLRSPNPAITEVLPQSLPTPSKLNPSPNPLQFPTKPEEVRLEAAEGISLQQALELARRNNRQLQIALLTLERSRANVREAQAEEYPTLSIQAGLNSRGSNVFNDANSSIGTSNNQLNQSVNQSSSNPNSSGSTTSNDVNSSIESGNNQLNQNDVNSSPGTSNNQLNQSANQTSSNSSNSSSNISNISSGGSSTGLSGTVQLSYNVYTAGARTARIRAAEEQLRFDQLDVERLTEQLRLEVSNDYYDLQQADEQVRINRAAVTNAEASLRDAQALEQAGVGTRFDVLRSQVQLANANQNLTNALSQQQISRRQLVNRLSLAQVANAIASDPVEIAGVWDLALEESIIQAFQNRAELQQQLVQRNISEQNRRIALASIKPRVAVSSSYNISDTFNDDRSFGDNYSLGANVNWNLYDGGAARARARAQSANIAISETNFADTRNQVRFEVEEAYSNLQSNLANIQTASAALEQAREALRLARLRFQAGVGTQTDVISAENDLTQAEGNRVTAILDYNRALASLTRAISSGSTP